MVVEDERITALALCKTLSRLGYDVAGAHSSGEAALKHIVERPPDLVLMDIHLEGAIDGIETAARIPSSLMIPVVYLSAFADGPVLQRARATKPYGYVVKPASERDLSAAIEMALERGETDRALRESEQRLRLALETAELGLWEMDAETEHILYRDHLGWTSESRPRLLADRFRDFLATVCKEDQDRVMEAFDLVSNAGESCEIEFRRLGADGQYRWYRVIGKAVHAHNDRRRRIIGVSRDITRARLAAEELQESDRNYRDLISSINGIIWEIDREQGVLTYVSDSVEQVLGYTAGEWLADPVFWERHIHRDDLADAIVRRHNAAQDGRSYESTYRMIAKNGQVVWIHEAVSVLGKKANKSTLRGVMVDITTLKKVELELQNNERELRRLLKDREQAMARAVAASQAKSSFLATMSHELRTPLNAILGFSDLMRAEVGGPVGNPTYRTYIEDIHQAGSLLLGIINSILDLSRIESGKLELKMERLCLKDVWSRIGSTVQVQAAARDIELKFLDPASPTWFHADRNALSQILVNLIANAIKFTPSGGLVEVGEELIGTGHVAVFVRDNGRGIPADKVKDVQKPFVQVSDSYVRDVGGVGLGLAICKSLAQAMSGRLRIISKLGKGTKVQVALLRLADADSTRRGT
jgi:PAS domain S-box-containing protein